MNPLIKKLVADRVAMPESDAWRDYAELLAAGSNDADGVDRMERAMDRLGKTVGDLSRDLMILNQARGFRETIDAGAGAMLAKNEAEAAVAAFDDETRRLAAERAGLRPALLEVVSEHANRHGNRRKAAADLNDLKRASGAILAGVPYATADELA